MEPICFLSRLKKKKQYLFKIKKMSDLRVIIRRIISESILLSEATPLEIREKFYKEIPEEEFKQIISADPTTNLNSNKMGGYSKWLLNLYKRKDLKLEDLYKVNEYLKIYEKYKLKVSEKDINKIKTIPDLYAIIKPFESGTEAVSKNDEIKKIKSEADKVYEDSEWLVVVPKTEEAACFYGKGTRWCTASTKGHNSFDDYNERGKLYININKIDGRKYQFHFGDEQFMDEDDRPIYFDEIKPSGGLEQFYDKNKLFFPEPTLETAIDRHDYDLFYELLSNTNPTVSDYEHAINKEEYDFAVSIFQYLDSKIIQSEALDFLFEIFPSYISDIGYSREEKEKEEEYDKIIKFIISEGFDVTDKNYAGNSLFNIILDVYGIKKFYKKIKQFKIVKEFKYMDSEELSNELDGAKKISDAYDELVSYKNKGRRVFLAGKDGKYHVENDVVGLTLNNIDVKEENLKYNISLLYKKKGTKYKGDVSKDRLFSFINQYDLFES